MIRSIGTYVLSMLLVGSFLPIQAQEWQLVTPIKNRSDLSGAKMIDYYTGFVIDKVEKFVLKTNDGGRSWERKPYNLLNAPQALWMWNDGQRGVIAATSGRFYMTSDGWATASSVQTFQGNNYCLYFVNDTLGFAGADNGKVLKTIDAGQTWMVQQTSVSSGVVAVHFINEQVGFAAPTGAMLFKTIDGGMTWNTVTHPAQYNVQDIHFYGPLVGICVGTGGEIIRTTDGGTTWNLITSPTPKSLLDIEVQGNVTLVCGHDGVMLRSTDQGLTWNLQTVGTRIHYVTSINPLGVGMSGSDGHIYRTEDFGQSWFPVQVGTASSYLNKVSFANDSIGATVGYMSVLGGTENAFMRTTDGGRHWSGAGGGGAWLGVHMRPDGAAVRGGSVGINAHSGDFFATAQNGTSPSVAIRSVHCFSPMSYIVAGGYVNSGFYKTNNGGATWNYTDRGTIQDMYFPSDSIGYACGDGGVLNKTTDGGNTWSFNLNSPVNNDQFTVFFLNDSVGWIGGATSGGRTTDGGLTWTSMSAIPSYTRSIIFTDADTGYCVGSSGQALRSVDGGVTWTHFINEPFDVNIGDMALVDGSLIAVGNTGDVFRAQLDCPNLAINPTISELNGTLYSSIVQGNQWYLNGVLINGATNSIFTPSLSGTYSLIVTDGMGCISGNSNTVAVIVTNVQERNDHGTLLIYPNPSKGQLHVAGSKIGAWIEVIDTHGRTLQRIRTISSTQLIDISALSKGTYGIRSISDDGSRVGWFIAE